MNLTIALISEDQVFIGSFSDLAKNAGHTVSAYHSASEALIKFKVSPPHLVFTEKNLKVVDGMMLLKKLKEDLPDMPVIVVFPLLSADCVLEAFRAGATDCLAKSFDESEIKTLLKAMSERLGAVHQLNHSLLPYGEDSTHIIGISSYVKSLHETIKQVCNTSANVLITGESGTGKELVAQALHRSGRRWSKPFVAINCSAIPENLLESELFGYVRGSFTGAHSDKRGLFEEAHGGTLFLDEIGDLSLALQVKLLRVLQEKKIRPVGSNLTKSVDVRIISATHRDLKAMSKEGAFREDLYYRINVIPIKVMPLREHPEDIPVLANHFIKKYSRINKMPLKTVPEDTLKILQAHHWPGNVRELENQIERAMVLSKDVALKKQCVIEILREASDPGIERISFDRPTLKKLEKRYIQIIIEEAKQGKEEAAKILGISRRTLYRKERQYGLASDKKD